MERMITYESPSQKNPANPDDYAQLEVYIFIYWNGDAANADIEEIVNRDSGALIKLSELPQDEQEHILAAVRARAEAHSAEAYQAYEEGLLERDAEQWRDEKFLRDTE